MPVLREREGTVSIKELSELTCIKPDDIIYTLQYLGLIQYQKGQHVLVTPPDKLDQCLREAGSWGLQVGPDRTGERWVRTGVCQASWLQSAVFLFTNSSCA
jgi:histone acetyltransferase MYST1